MPMIAFELKNAPKSTVFVLALKHCIAKVYNENPHHYSKECTEFQQLREAAVHASRDCMGCSTLKKYYAQLQFLRSRFPDAEKNGLGIEFSWDDVYSGKAVSSTDIRFEQGSVLYNIGALHSQLGAMDSRNNPEGMKVSCVHFQCAAWAFQQLRDCFEQNMSPDMNHDLLTFMFNLMLAQAQECILEKSMMDNRKSSITAKVAAQIIEYYQQALRYLEECNAVNIVGSKRYKEWKKRIELKMNYHQCIVYYYQGCQAEEQEKWGECVAFFQAAVDKLNEAIKLAKNEDADINEALRFTMDVVGGKYNNAKKDNDFIYYDKVPPFDSLPEVKGAQLVKGIQFNYNDPEISGPDIFKKLVPIEVHEASSLYSEEKAKLLRRIGGLIEEKNEELQQFLSSLQLDPAKIEPASEPLPQILLEKCAAISVKPNAIKDLTASMTSLSNVSIDVEGNISDIMELLDKAQSLQKEFGDAKSKAALEEKHNECLKYKEGLTKASQSNLELHKAMTAHVDNLRLLSSPLDQLQSSLPSMDHNISSDDQEIINQMLKLMAKVDEMKNQRSMLEDQLRKQIQEDDITNVLVTREVSNRDEFFQEQLKKHDKEVALIEQNLSAQENILKALTETNAKYANIRKQMEETSQRRAAKVDALVQSYDVYEDLLAKCQKGVEFYNKLQKNVDTLSEQVQTLYQELEKKKSALDNTKPKVVSLSSEPVNNSVTSVPGMPPLSDTETTPRLTLKDYLPYMKPATFGKNSGQLQAEQLAPANTTNVLDPSSMMAMYGNVSTGITQIPQIPMHAGSLPNSHAASPVHIPKQPSSQPGSPGHLPQKVDPGISRGTTPGLPDQTSYGFAGANQANAINRSIPSCIPASAPSSLPTTSMMGQPVCPDQIFSPTSAPGAPSTRRPLSTGMNCAPSGMGTPPGGPSAVGGFGQGAALGQPIQATQQPANQQPCAYSSQPSQYNSSSNTVCLPAQSQSPASPSGMSQNASLTSVPSQAAIPQQGLAQGPAAPGQPQPPGSAQSYVNQYPGQLPHGPGGQRYYPTSTLSSAVSGTYISQHTSYSNQPQPGAAVLTTGVANQHVQPATSLSYNSGVQASQWSQAGVAPGSVSQPYSGRLAGTGVTSQQMSTGQHIQMQHISVSQPNQKISSSVPAVQSAQPPAAQPSHHFNKNLQTQLTAAGQVTASQPSTGQPVQPSTTYPGQLSVGQPAQLSSSYPGQVGQLSSSNPAQPPTGQLGQMSTSHPNQSSMRQPAQLSASYPGQLSTGQPAQLSNSYTGQQTAGQQGNLPTSYRGQMLTGQSDQQFTQQPATGQLAPGHLVKQFTGQAGQVGTGQQNTPTQGKAGQLPGGQTSHTQHPPQMLPQQSAPGQSWGQRPGTHVQPHSSTISYQYSQTTGSTGQGVPSSTGIGQTAVNRYPGPGTYGNASAQTGASAYQMTCASNVIRPGGSQCQYPCQSLPINSQATGGVHNTVLPTSQPQISSVQSNAYSYAYQTQGQTGPSQQMGQYPQYQQGYSQPQQQQPQQQQLTACQTQQNGQNQSQTPVTPNLPSPLQPIEAPLSTSFTQPAAQAQNLERASSLPPPNNVNPSQVTASQAKLGQATSSSLDDLLSSSPERSKNGSPLKTNDVLKPKVITEQEIREQREEQIKNSLKQSVTHDPYMDQEVLNRFVVEVEKYEKFVESMIKETLSGPTPLDKEWKELAENQEKEAKKHSMAIARCYPLKNRFPDIMPYDSTRVMLKGGKDDYINASHLGDLSPVCPKFIATQAPLPVTMVDFWQMVYEQGTEVIVALCQEYEAGKKNHVYWPAEKGQTITHGPFTLYLQSSRNKQGWIERIITLTHKETRHSRSVVHLQFLNWPSGGIPSSPAVILQFICEVHMFFIQQRNLVKPVIVHCSNGVDRTGTFCVIYAGIQEINQGHGLVNVTELVKQLREKRKYMVGDKELLRFCHSAILYYAQDLLMKRGILTNCATFSDKLPAPGRKTHQRKPSEDFILGTNINLNTIQSSVAKMKINNSNAQCTSSVQDSDPAPSQNSDPDTAAPPGQMSSEQDSKVSTVHQPDDQDKQTGSSNAVDESQASNLPSASSNNTQPLLSNLPPSLADLQNPKTFSLEVTPPSKRKITKSSFLNPTSHLQDKAEDPSDPLSSLDPLWTIKQDKT